MGYEWLAIAMFVGFLALLLSGYPVAFSFAGTGLVFGLLGWMVGAFEPARLLLLPNLWFGTMGNFTLLAIPFFVFLGAVLEKSGLAEDLLETVGILIGPLRGGMALAVVLAIEVALAVAMAVTVADVVVVPDETPEHEGRCHVPGAAVTGCSAESTEENTTRMDTKAFTRANNAKVLLMEKL